MHVCVLVCLPDVEVIIKQKHQKVISKTENSETKKTMVIGDTTFNSSNEENSTNPHDSIFRRGNAPLWNWGDACKIFR